MKRHRLMQITHDLAIGGLQKVVVNICKTIDRDKFHVSVLCLRDLGEFVPEVERLGIKVMYLLQKKYGTDYFSFLKVARILRQEKIEIIHTHNIQPFIDGTIGAFLSGVKTVVHTDHGRKFPDKKRYMLAERILSHFVYKVVGVSEDTSNNLIKYEKISPRKIITIPNGIDGSKYLTNIDKDKKKEELGINNDGPIIGLGARLTKIKGITYLLQSMPETIKEFPDITLIIAGKGEIEEELKREATLLGIHKNVLFLEPRLDMHELLRLFDIFVLPSLSEGLPMILLEAMAAGCPIIATNVGGIHTAIKHGKNGFLIEPGQPDAITSETIKLLSDDSLRQQFSSNNIKDFKEKYSAEKMTRKYEKLYLRN